MTDRPGVKTLALSGLALTAALALSACSDDKGSDEAAPSGETSASSSAPAAAGKPVVDQLPTTPIEQLLLGKDEVPGGAVPSPVADDAAAKAVEAWEQTQAQQMYDDPACDAAGRTETPLNHVGKDGKSEMIQYKDANDETRVHSFADVLVPAKIEPFLDRARFEACKGSAKAGQPEVQMQMQVADAPAVEGATGFRVTTSFVSTKADGTKASLTLVSLRGYAHGITVAMDYQGSAADGETEAVIPEAKQVQDKLYTDQMTKIVNAQ